MGSEQGGCGLEITLLGWKNYAWGEFLLITLNEVNAKGWPLSGVYGVCWGGMEMC